MVAALDLDIGKLRKTRYSGGAGGAATVSVGGIQLQQKQQQQQRMLTSTQELNLKS